MSGPGYTVSETVSTVPGRSTNVLRKRFPRNFDAAAQENKQLATVPYNAANRYLTAEDVAGVFAKVGMEVQVNDLALYQRAAVHASYLTSCLELPDDAVAPGGWSGDPDLGRAVPVLRAEGYLVDYERIVPLQELSGERLEYLGDSVCGCSVATYLYQRFPDEDEGFMTKLRTRLVNGSTLGEFAQRLGMAELVVISRYVEAVQNGRQNHRVLEDVFEAFVGALYEDNFRSGSGAAFALCHEFMIKVCETFADFTELIYRSDNYKDILLRAYQRDHGVFPKYRELMVENRDGVKVYHMSVLSPDGTRVVATGSSAKKKTAEQLASKEALRKLGALDDNGQEAE